MISLAGRPVPGFGATLAGVGVGTLERRNPLPPGRYWIDLFEQDSPAWLAWRARNGVKIEVTEHFDGSPSRDFIIFRVDTPVTWEGPGYPTIAAPGVKSSTDTGQRPAPIKDPLDTVTDFIFGDSTSTARTVGGILAVVAGGALIIYIIAGATAPSPRYVRS